jgi:iron(III) transport system ATP-binding protein
LLTVTDLVKTFPSSKSEKGGPVVAVGGITFSIEPGQMFTLLGPSGCGKTTTLRSVAGLETPDSGEIQVGDRVLYSSEKKIRVPANKRSLGMVFQSYAIWPHMNVFKNVAFPLEVDQGKRLSRREITERVENVLAVVQLGALAGRQATDLSGGQQQRLALARALVMEPELLLLDEPLSNLDAKLREEMRFELKRLQRELGITAVYVTHDQIEALAMSNQIAVMNSGRIEQIGRPREVYERPASRFVAGFIGTTNFLTGKVDEARSDWARVVTSTGRLEVSTPIAFTSGADVTVSIRPEHIGITTVGDASPADASEWVGTVSTRAFLGEAVDHLVTIGGMELRVRCPATKSISPGTRVRLDLPREHCLVVREEV